MGLLKLPFFRNEKIFYLFSNHLLTFLSWTLIKERNDSCPKNTFLSKIKNNG